jgi:hypothetical protein
LVQNNSAGFQKVRVFPDTVAVMKRQFPVTLEDGFHNLDLPQTGCIPEMLEAYFIEVVL